MDARVDPRSPGSLPRGLWNYYFCEEWRVAASIDRAWTAIRDLEAYPRWWREFVEVKRLNDLDGVGSQVAVHAKAALPYHMYFNLEAIVEERPRLAIVRVRGDLNGEMRWRLEPDPEFVAAGGAGTHLIFDESVRTGKPLLNVLAPLFKPLFAWNHKVMMANGERGLRRYLGAQP
ncbi:MAG TPA: SRPBCC family protein [bacterium]|nr:SRPBCC family protein [bacterium]